MKLLIISESINVEDSSGSKVNVALISNLKKAGYQLKVLHFSHKEIQLDGIECQLIKEIKFSLNYLLSRIVRRFQLKTNIIINDSLEGLFGFSFTHINDSNSIAKAVKKEVNFNTPDFILTLSKGGSFRPHKAMLKLPELHQKWLAYIHDPYPFHMYPRPYNRVETSYKQKEKFMSDIAAKSKKIIFPSALLKEWMESYFPVIANKSLIVPHQINSAEVVQETPDFFDKNDFSLLHAGNLLTPRNPKFLIEAFIRFLEKNPNASNHAKLYFIGNNVFHKQTLEPYQNHPNIVIKDYMQYSIVQNLERQATANIILEAISEISPFLPGKFPNCIMADKPILLLGPYYSEVKRLLGKDYPYWSETNNVEAIEGVISSLYETWMSNPEQLKLNRKDLFDYSTEKKLKQIFDDIQK